MDAQETLLLTLLLLLLESARRSICIGEGMEAVEKDIAKANKGGPADAGLHLSVFQPKGPGTADLFR
jgi:hypothetical protein